MRFSQNLKTVFKRTYSHMYQLSIIYKCRIARIKNQRVIVLFGTPRHLNLGDQAILLAEHNFIQKNFRSTVLIDIPMPVLRFNRNILESVVTKETILIGHGGGNMGDAYIQEEHCRREVITNYPNNRIVIFPQTFDYSDTPVGRKELQLSQTIYAQHKILTIIAREEFSYKQIKKYYPTNNILLTPDIVLSSEPQLKQKRRDIILVCLRNDKEGVLKNADKMKILHDLEAHQLKVLTTDTVSKKQLVIKRKPPRVLITKIRQFATSRLVITDRLHGMVFAAITGTPCIVISNYNHKVSGTYAWIKSLPYIKYCTDLEKLDKMVKQGLKLNTNNFDPSIYSRSWNSIISAIRGEKYE